MIYSNTKRTKLVMPEYGRNVQQMVDYMLNIKDKRERTRAANTIIDVMSNFSPHQKEGHNFRQKLWDHLMIMSGFKLDVNTQFELIQRKNYQQNPKKLPYPQKTISYKHYGKTIKALINKIIAMKDSVEKEALIFLTANHMKKAIYMWNKKDNVLDKSVFEDLKKLSGGKIIISPFTKLSDFKSITHKKSHSHKRKKGGDKRRRRY